MTINCCSRAILRKISVAGILLLASLADAKLILDDCNVSTKTYLQDMHGKKSSFSRVLQVEVEKITKLMKDELHANGIMIVIMNAKNGQIVAMTNTSENILDAIQNTEIIRYSYEPGSVMKTITLSIALDQQLVKRYDLIPCYNGRYIINNKVIIDRYKFDYLSAEDVIVQSSNIGIAQIGQKISGFDFFNGLQNFGFFQESTDDLKNESIGYIPSLSYLNNIIYKSTTSYGYGMRANLLQLVKAYNVFNNDGKIISPTVFIENLENRPVKQILSQKNANIIKDILIEVIKKGTAQNATIAGLEIGGKTGTAHMVENGAYVNKSNATFIGFANDAKNKYTIGVLVKNPKTSQYSSTTAVPVFKKVVETMIRNGFLKPSLDSSIREKSIY